MRELTSGNCAPLRRHAVIVTRPVGRCRGLLRATEKLGARALAMPGSSLRLTENIAAARQALHIAQHADAVVFGSPSAVRFALRIDPGWRAGRRVRVLALGPATARALRRAGIAAQVPQHRFDSEGLLASAALNGVRRLALITAPDGRRLIESNLRARGVIVDVVHVYQRAPARLDRRHLMPLLGERRHLLLLLSSVETVSNLRAALSEPAWRKLASATVIASSKRVRTAAVKAGLHKTAIAASALAADLLAAAVAVARGHAAIR